MQIFGTDMIFGDFRASMFQCTAIASFGSSGDSEEDTNIGMDITREFIADNPVPVYIGQTYSQVLEPVITITKNDCVTDNIYFTEFECRAILRLVTGQNKYEWLKMITDNLEESVVYRAKVVSVAYQRTNGYVSGIILNMQCDSQFGWSDEQNITINATANKAFNIFLNDDDLWGYNYPIVTITPSTAGNLSVVNSLDDNWKVTLSGVKANEVITYDCKNEIINSSRSSSGTAAVNMLNYSNCHFFRLLPDKNTFTSNLSAKFVFTFREKRKTAFAVY